MYHQALLVTDSPPVDLITDALHVSDPVESLESTRTGEEFGFGGKVFLVTVDTPSGTTRVIAKQETLEQVQRVTAAYQRFSPTMLDHVPALLASDGQWNIFEYLDDVTQGDGLAIQNWQLEPLIRLLGRLHASTWQTAAPGWMPEHWDRTLWDDRLATVQRRYPQTEPSLLSRLADLHDEIPACFDALASGPSALVHMDSGFDNTLWRPDGSVVLLDWSNARTWAPGFDLVSHLAESDPQQLIGIYLEELSDNDISIPDLTSHLVAAGKLFVRGLIGFAGHPSEDIHPRLRRFREVALGDVSKLLTWIDTISR